MGIVQIAEGNQAPPSRAKPTQDSAVEEQHRFEFISKLLITSRLGARVSLSHHYRTSGPVSFLKALQNFPRILVALKAEYLYCSM